MNSFGRAISTLTLLLACCAANAFDTNTPQTFDQLCARDSSGYPADPDVINCWGFESDSEFYYRNHGSTCTDPDTGAPLFSDHVNGDLNSTPVLNGIMNSQTCLYPKRVAQHSTSGSYSLLVQQVDEGGGNGGGTFAPYFKHYIGSDGKRKFAAFGAGADFWIHWRYRQDANLFNYHSKRFMVTHEESAYEIVLNAYQPGGGNTTPPFNAMCAYNNKGTYGFGCATSKFYEADKWHTIMMHIRLADNAALTNGLFELWFDGERVLFQDGFPMNGLELFEPYADDLDWETQHEINALMRLDFLLFENGKTGVGSRPPGSMYIDDVIVSTKRPPVILGAGGGDGVAPMAPEGLTVD